MGQVSPLGKVQSHKGIARLQAGHDDGHVRLGARMRLHVGIFRVIQLAEPVDGQLLNLVHHLTPTIVAFARIAFRIFIGDEFQSGRLPLFLFLDKVKNL